MFPSRPIAPELAALALGALALCGCGRYGFDPLGLRPLDPPGEGCGQRCDSLDAGGGEPTDGGSDSTSRDAETGPGPSDGGGTPPADGATPTPDSAMPPPPCMQGLFCSGFEAQSLADWDSPIALNGTTAHTTDPVRAGTGALSTVASTPGGAAMLTKRGFGPFSSGAFYVRAHYFVPSSTQRTDFALLTVGDVTLALSGGVSVFVANDGFALAADMGSIARMGTLTVPVDRWFCLELSVQISDKQGRATLWLDGVEENFLPGAPTLPLGGVTTIGVGIASAGSSQPSARVFVDDVVVDTNPIGCE